MRLYTLLKQALYKLGLIADYVVDTGESGIWTYEKWASGKAICWGTQSNYITFTSPMTNMGYASITVNLPSELFASVKQVIPTQKDTTGVQFTLYGTPYAITTKSFKNNVMRVFNASAMTAVFSYEVIGTWGGVARNLLNLRRWIPCGYSPY